MVTNSIEAAEASAALSALSEEEVALEDSRLKPHKGHPTGHWFDTSEPPPDSTCDYSSNLQIMLFDEAHGSAYE
jgi:hypothetical protein